MRGLVTVFRKEVIENARDRRTILNALLVGPLFGPVLFVLMIGFMMNIEEEKAAAKLTLPVAGESNAPNLVRHLRQQGVKVEPPPDDPEAAVRNKDVDIVLRIPEGFGEDWRAGRPARVELLYDGSRIDLRTTVRRVRGLVQGYAQQTAGLRLQARGLDPRVAAPIAVIERDVSSVQERAAMLLSMLPYFLIMSAFLGGLYLAIDTTTGERERQSLEPLLINPVPREQIMLGKLAATTLFAGASATLSALAFAIGIRFMPTGPLGVDLSVSPVAVFGIIGVILPVVLMASALQTIVAAFSKSYREAQTYLQFLIIVPMIPTLMLALNPLKPTLALYATPIMGQSILITSLVRGEDIDAVAVAMSAGGTLLLAAVLAVICMRLYHREGLALGN